MFHRQALLGHAEDVVRRALARGADEAEVFIAAGEGLSVELEAGQVSVTSTDRSVGMGVRIVQGGRVGFASTSGLGDGVACIEAALRLARAAPAKGYRLPAPGPAPPSVEQWDDALATLDPGTATELARRMLSTWQKEAPQMRFPGGGVSMDTGWQAIASSTGVAAAGRSTMCSASASLVHDAGTTVSAWDALTTPDLGLDPEAFVSALIDKTQRLAHPAPAPHAGSVDIIFSPDAGAELFGSFIGAAVDGDDAMRGNTPWSDRLGAQVADTGVQVFDDPVSAPVGAHAWDDEGMTISPRPIIADGQLRSFLFDSTDAHEHGTAPTASAGRDGFASRPHTDLHHIVLKHRDTRDLDGLIGQVKDGYLVDTLLGAHTANMTTGEFSVTAPNVWAIKGGELAGPCKEIALAGSVPDALMQLQAASSQMRLRPGSRIPHLWVRGLNVSV